MVISTQIVASVHPDERSARAIEREFDGLLKRGASLRCVGGARDNPHLLLERGFRPKAKLELFDTSFYLSSPRQNPDLRFMVAYVTKHRPRGRKAQVEIYPRIFYKDVSLIWRVASHLVVREDETWVGKGDVVVERDELGEIEYSSESTTDLPLEIQASLEELNRRISRVPFNEDVLPLVLQTATNDRIVAFSEFTKPRRLAQADPKNLVHGGKRVVSFKRQNVPESLRFAAGFQPDFVGGVLDETETTSSMYGGLIRRFRILSRNKRIQYMFFLGPHHAWMIPPQTLMTELTTFGVRTVDVEVDEDAFVPGYEYHYMDELEDPPELHSQIPPGFAGAASRHDESRADASAWLDRLPVIREFREELGGDVAR